MHLQGNELVISYHEQLEDTDFAVVYKGYIDNCARLRNVLWTVVNFNFSDNSYEDGRFRVAVSVSREEASENP